MNGSILSDAEKSGTSITERRAAVGKACVDDT
jgi:hypothetical protein